MIFETTVFLFTIFKLYQKALETSRMGSSLLVTLYRDGVCYYFVIMLYQHCRLKSANPELCRLSSVLIP